MATYCFVHKYGRLDVSVKTIYWSDVAIIELMLSFLLKNHRETSQSFRLIWLFPGLVLPAKEATRKKNDSIETRNEEGLLTDGTTLGEKSERDNTREQYARKDPLARIPHVPRSVLNLYNQEKCCLHTLPYKRFAAIASIKQW